jgi:RNA polymerase sigma factor (TIGR02999 family)
MSGVTQILKQIESGDPSAADQLLPLVYHELRKLAAARLNHESPGHTLQPTALVHEAYIRLVDTEQAQPWSSRGHFFAAAAEAMRRILIDNARARRSARRGGAHERVDLDNQQIVAPARTDDLIALDEALDQLASHDARKAELVKLRYFAGLTLHDAAQVLGISESTADADWAYAKAWLRVRLAE